MTLEQRVVVVEQELQILKTQIQATLLMIQEHLLKNTYPALRTNESLSGSQAGGDTSAARSGSVKRVAVSALDMGSEAVVEEKPLPPARHEQQWQPVEQVARREERQPAPQPVRREERQSAPQVTRREERQSAPQAAYRDEWSSDSQAEPDEPRQTEQPHQAADVRLWIELDKWVNQKIKEVGIERTRELISLFDGPERRLLMHVVEIYEEGAEPQLRSVPTHQQRSMPTSKSRTIAEEFQNHALANQARNATYRPFGEHQELVLRLIADILSANEATPVSARSNGQAKH